jgi:hypothetical protein
MNEDIGILALDQLIYNREDQGILRGLREVLPPEINVLSHQSTALGLLDFIESHKRLIILDKDNTSYGKQTLLGEVQYWGHFTGGMPEDIVVIGVDSEKESLEPVLECLERWDRLQ